MTACWPGGTWVALAPPPDRGVVAQRREQRVHRRPAVAGRRGEPAHPHAPHPRGHVAVRGRRANATADDLRRQLEGRGQARRSVGRRERMLTVERLVEGDAEREWIRASRAATRSPPPASRGAGQPEVRDADASVGAEKRVVRLEVAMDDPGGVPRRRAPRPARANVATTSRHGRRPARTHARSVPPSRCSTAMNTSSPTVPTSKIGCDRGQNASQPGLSAHMPGGTFPSTVRRARSEPAAPDQPPSPAYTDAWSL